MGTSKSNLINEIANLVLTGGRRTSAANVRQVLTDMVNSYSDITTYQIGITAYANGGQANATPLVSKISRVDLVPLNNGSVQLVAALPGAEMQVLNNDEVNDLNIYTLYGNEDKFLGMAPNVCQIVVAGGRLKLFCFEIGIWTIIS